MRDSTINLTLTSPPYGAMKDYGSKKQIGFGQTYDEYLNSLVNIFAALHRKTVNTGSLWVVVDTFKENSTLRLLPFDLCSRLSGVGWLLKDIIIWNKTRTLPWSGRGQFRRIFEYILFFAKSSDFKYHVDRIKEPDGLKEWWVKYPERYSPEGKVPSSIWTFPIPVQGSWSKSDFRHFCPFPSSLVERILLLTTDRGDRVFDPFAGSGVVLAQAKATGRRYIGCDVNKTYREQFSEIVTDDIRRKWDLKKERVAKNGAQQLALAERIYKLRQTKFPKALFKQLETSLGEAVLKRVKFILAVAAPLGREAPPHCFSKVTVHLVCNGKTPLALVEEKARVLVKKPPLSKYGIVPEVHVLAWSRFSERSNAARKQWFLYNEGVTHDFRAKLPSKFWRSAVPGEWKRVPPIVMNVGVQQKLVRTWAPKED
ncbi:MAG: site-specific DNA-methyltransferase [Terriglobales bacterium]